MIGSVRTGGLTGLGFSFGSDFLPPFVVFGTLGAFGNFGGLISFGGLGPLDGLFTFGGLGPFGGFISFGGLPWLDFPPVGGLPWPHFGLSIGLPTGDFFWSTFGEGLPFGEGLLSPQPWAKAFENQIISIKISWFKSHFLNGQRKNLGNWIQNSEKIYFFWFGFTSILSKLE